MMINKFLVLALCVLAAASVLAESPGVLDPRCTISFESDPGRLRVPLPHEDSGAHGLTLALYDGPDNEHAWFISTNPDEDTATVSYAHWGDNKLVSSIPFDGTAWTNSGLYFVRNSLWFRQGPLFRQLNPWTLEEQPQHAFSLPTNSLVNDETNWISHAFDFKHNWLWLGSDDGVVARVSLWGDEDGSSSMSFFAADIAGGVGNPIRMMTVDPVWGSTYAGDLYIATVNEDTEVLHLHQFQMSEFDESDAEVRASPPLHSMVDLPGVDMHKSNRTNNFFYPAKDLHMDWGVWQDQEDDILYLLVNFNETWSVGLDEDGRLDETTWTRHVLELEDDIWAYTFTPEYVIGVGFLSYYDVTTKEWGILMIDLFHHTTLDTFEVSNQRAPYQMRFHHKEGVLATLEFDFPHDNDTEADSNNFYTELVWYDTTCGSGCGKEGINLEEYYDVDFAVRTCKTCSPGHYSHDPHAACKACPSGTVGADVEGANTALACQPCPEGTKQPYHGQSGSTDDKCRDCLSEKCPVGSGVGVPVTYPLTTHSRAYVNNLYAALEDSNRHEAAVDIHWISFVSLITLDLVLLCGFCAWCRGANQADTVGADPTSPGAPKASRNSCCGRCLSSFDCFYQTSGYTPIGGVVRRRKTSLGGFCSLLAALFMAYMFVVLTVEFGLRNDDLNTGILPGSLPLAGPDVTVNVTFPTWGVFDCCIDEDGARSPQVTLEGLHHSHRYTTCHDTQGVCTFTWHCRDCQMNPVSHVNFRFHESFANAVRLSVGVREDLFENQDSAYAVIAPEGDHVYRGEEPVAASFSLTPVHLEHYFSHVFEQEYGYLVENGTQRGGATTNSASFANWEGGEDPDTNDLNVRVTLFSFQNGHVEVEVLPRITTWDFIAQLLAAVGGVYVVFQGCMACFVRRHSGGLYESYQDKDFALSSAPGGAAGSPQQSNAGKSGDAFTTLDDEDDDDEDVNVYPGGEETEKAEIEGQQAGLGGSDEEDGGAGGDSVIAESAGGEDDDGATTTTTTTTSNDNASLI